MPQGISQWAYTGFAGKNLWRNKRRENRLIEKK
jgi:hypothetical protein